MGASLPVGPGAGRGRNLSADLNLVPFIDLLCATITFLLATAVWSQTSAIPVQQMVRDDIIDGYTEPTVPLLTLHLRADGVWLGRSLETGRNHPQVGTTYDWDAIRADLVADHDTWPGQSQIIIVTDDGVPYEHMIHALDLSRAQGYSETILGGGPAAPTPG